MTWLLAASNSQQAQFLPPVAAILLKTLNSFSML